MNKKVLGITLSTFILVACNNTESPTNNVSTETEKTVKQEVKKHEAVKLPVTVFTNNDYASSTGNNVIFERTIESVTISDFKDETEEIVFFDKYDVSIESRQIDLINNYKKVTINMSHSIENEGNHFFWSEPYVLSKNTNFVVGDADLVTNEFVNQQLRTASIDYKMGSTDELTGSVILAIPNEFVSDSLQIKTVKEQDDNLEVIYIDLEIEK